MTEHYRGIDREKLLERDAYSTDTYFSMAQLCSFAHQLNHIWAMKPKSVVEVGIGNGFVSTFLRRSGIRVTTADVNAALEPDICAPLSEIPPLLNEKIDVVVCCEVLEHMPLEELDANLDSLRAMGERLFLTLPNSKRAWGLGGVAFLPKIGARLIDLNVDIPWHRPIAGGPHFWEVGYSRQCTRKALVSRLKTRYRSVRTGRFTLNPYHIYFICE